jgi:hypothetical protein
MPTTHTELNDCLDCARSHGQLPIDKSGQVEAQAAKQRNDQAEAERHIDLRNRQQQEAALENTSRISGENKIREFGDLVGTIWVEREGAKSPDICAIIAQRGAGAFCIAHVWSGFFGYACYIAGRTISFGRSTVFIKAVADAVRRGVDRLGIASRLPVVSDADQRETRPMAG